LYTTAGYFLLAVNGLAIACDVDEAAREYEPKGQPASIASLFLDADVIDVLRLE